MRCEKFDKLIYLFLDGRLNQSETEELKKHLSECKRCQERLSFLESVEGRARKIEAEEPSQEYWDTFSSRVREKIIARKERSPVFGLKKAFENIFSFSPFKIKVAAGVVSVTLVFIVGKLYVDYRGQEILPSKTVTQTEEQPQLDIMEMEKKEGFPVEQGRRKIRSISEKPEMKREPATTVQQEGKAIPPKREGVEKEALLKKEKITAQPKVAEEKTVPAYAPTLEDQTLAEPEKSPKEPIVSPDIKQIGAGVEKEAEETLIGKMAGPERVTHKAEEPPQEGKLEEILAPQVGFVGFRAPLPIAGYSVNGNSIPDLREADTLMHADTLIRVIQVWRAHIKKNPIDSLSKQGYLQIATAYYLLAKLSQDTTLISEGLKLMEEYLEQIKDPTVKDNLSNRIEKIKALRQR